MVQEGFPPQDLPGGSLPWIPGGDSTPGIPLGITPRIPWGNAPPEGSPEKIPQGDPPKGPPPKVIPSEKVPVENLNFLYFFVGGLTLKPC
jgi:hypothetical protein